MFNDAVKHYEQNGGINVLLGVWKTDAVYAKGSSDNLIDFNKYFTDNNITNPTSSDLEAAARSTFTGSRAELNGYGNINVVDAQRVQGSSNQYNYVEVEFTQ